MSDKNSVEHWTTVSSAVENTNLMWSRHCHHRLRSASAYVYFPWSFLCLFYAKKNSVCIKFVNKTRIIWAHSVEWKKERRKNEVIHTFAEGVWPFGMWCAAAILKAYKIKLHSWQQPLCIEKPVRFYRSLFIFLLFYSFSPF